MKENDHHHHEKVTEFFIDMQEFDTKAPELTPRVLLVDFANEDPSKTTLESRHGNETKKYLDLDTPIEIKNGMKFFVLHNEPTPVS